MNSVDDLWMLVSERRKAERKRMTTFTTTATGAIIASDGRIWGTR